MRALWLAKGVRRTEDRQTLLSLARVAAFSTAPEKGTEVTFRINGGYPIED